MGQFFPVTLVSHSLVKWQTCKTTRSFHVSLDLFFLKNLKSIIIECYMFFKGIKALHKLLLTPRQGTFLKADLTHHWRSHLLGIYGYTKRHVLIQKIIYDLCELIYATLSCVAWLVVGKKYNYRTLLLLIIRYQTLLLFRTVIGCRNEIRPGIILIH